MGKKMIWHSYYSQGQIPHVTADKGSFWWKDLLHLSDKFRGVASCSVGNGTTVLFWLHGRLFSFAKNQKIFVAAFLSASDLTRHFYLPLSEQAHQEFTKLQEIIQDMQLREEDKDQWYYIWGAQKYTSKSFYNHAYEDFQPPKPFLWIWNSRCCNKLRVFSWLLLMDRLNTRNLLKRKKFKIEGNNYRCILCASHREETAMHLFFTCPFATRCWQEIGIQWLYEIPFFQMLEIAKHNFSGNFFMEIFIVATWQIWKQKNGLIFENSPVSINRWKNNFVDECLNQAHRMKESLKIPFLNWVNSHV